MEHSGGWSVLYESLQVVVQEGQLLSFGRATYGRIGRLDVEVNKDLSVPEARPVDNLDGVTVTGMAAGELLVTCFSVKRLLVPSVFN